MSLEGAGPSEPTKRNYSTENAEGRQTPRRKVENGERTKKREKVTRNVNVNEGGAALGEPSPRGATRYIPHREGGCAKRPHRIGLMQMCRAPPSRARGVFAP